MAIQTPKGTRDFFPEDQRIQNHIFDTWRATCRKFGYDEYEGPMFEHLELFTEKSGDEIVRQLYNFQDKAGRDIALRPEMTPTLARMIVAKGRNLKKPAKWFSIPRLFRYEKAQKGRLREFFQLNLDILGSAGIHAEADLLAAICEMLRAFGLTGSDFVIGISSRRLLAEFLTEIGTPNADLVYPALDKRLKIGPEEFAKELETAGLDATQRQRLDGLMASTSLEGLEAAVTSEGAKAALAELRQLFDLLTTLGYGNEITLDLSVVRGLAYYTGIVFEVFDRNKSMRAVAGGGRYDKLCAKLGGEDVTGVGFGMGDVVLADLLRDRGLLPTGAPDIDCFVVTVKGDLTACFQLARDLRALGLTVSHPLNTGKLGKQMEQASHTGARVAIFVDGDRSTGGLYETKDLRNGEQTVTDIAGIAALARKENA